MPDSLKNKTLGALFWSFVQGISLRGVQFVVGIIIARLLLPEQFGLIAMLTIFLEVARSFVNSGFGAALIQKQGVTEKDTNSIFYFNILVSVIAVVCLCGLAPWVADFYKQPDLTPLLRVMSILLVINALGQVQDVLLVKALDFKRQTKVALTASFLSGMIGMGMAYRGFGVWSLAAQQLSSAAFRTVLLWIFCKWRPAWIFSMQSLREMFRFSSKLLASGLLNTIFGNVYLIVIGKLFSPGDLGHFARAKSIQKLPSHTLSEMVSKVTFPVFSTIQDDPERMKRAMKRVLTTLVMVNFPLMIGLAVVARPLVLVLLTDKWAPCIPYLQLYCLVGLMYPLHLINLNVLQAMGRSDLFLRLEIIKKALTVLNIAIAWRWGIMALITGQIIASLAGYYLNAYYNKALLQYSIWEQIRDLYPYFLNATLMGAIVYAMVYLPISGHIILLVCQIVTGGVVYGLFCWIFRFPAYMDLQQMVVSRLQLKTIP